ncbi:MAG: hypothetical protein GQ561_05215 [Calditrichae bacterium]|nr:hypothetical protein [Calditrichia bacterium]
MARFLIFGLVLLVCANILVAQDYKSEVKEQVPLILKALNHNISLEDKIRKNCVIAVLYNPQNSTSDNERKVISDVLNDHKKIKVHGKKIKVVEIPMTMDLNLEKQVIIKKINAFWLTSGTQPYVNNIRESAKYNQVMTITANPDLVIGALAALGTQKTESGHKLLLNLSEANNINASLSQNLLSEAIVIQ